MPHLSQLQRAHKKDGFTVIGVTSVDRSNTLEAVQAMVKDKGDVMDYTVAFDEDRKTNEAWMKASGQGGIPTSFLVDKAGKIAWIGHPASADLPIGMILAGTWDYEKGPALLKKIAEQQKEIFTVANEDPEKALGMIDALYKEHPVLAGSMDDMRFSLLLSLPKMADAAAELGGKLVDKAIESKDPMALNQVAWTLVDPETKFEERHIPLALRAATAASKLTDDKDGAILDTLARAHFWNGDLDKALEIQLKAVENSEGPMKAQIEEVVAEYEKAIEESKAEAGK